jgi:hypothetical protein
MIACIVPSMSFATTHSFQHIFFPIIVPSRDGTALQQGSGSTKADGGQAKKFSLRKVSNGRKLLGWIAAERLGCGWQTLDAFASHRRDENGQQKKAL